MRNSILITQRIDFIAQRDEIRDCLDQRLIEFVSNLGFVPIPVPNFKNDIENKINDYLELIKPKGIILSGGNDIGQYPYRDEIEQKLISISIVNNIPLIGICRGMQSIQISFKGEIEKGSNHVGKKHMIENNLGNRLVVNSYHDYLIKVAPERLSAIYKAADGTIESFKAKEHSIFGIMWHPEREKYPVLTDVNFFKMVFNKSHR